jgi:hypothetical protein
MNKIFLVFLLCLIPSFTFAQSTAVPVSELPYYPTASSRPGWEERGSRWAKWLSSGVRIGGGSGTMVYFDGKEMYVISAGHVVQSRSSSVQRPNNKFVTIEVFYHNNTKLPEVAKYRGQVLCSVYDGVYDVTLIKFTPDWKGAYKQYAPIAPKDYKLVADQYYHSIGCDGRSEVAHYLVKYVNERQSGGVTEIITIENSPRKGRSGGGVLTDDGQLVFICSRGSAQYAYWTSLYQIHKFLNDEGYDFVLTGGRVRNIPVRDIENRRIMPKDYLPLPSKL